jgi:cephalosporin-C deacetylase-like acetyl esterase
MKPSIALLAVLALGLPAVWTHPHLAAGADREAMLQTLRQLDTDVLQEDVVAKPRSMLADDIRARRTEINRRDVLAWRAIESKEDWESHRDKAMAAMRKSLGSVPLAESDRPASISPRVTKTLQGDGYTIDCVLFPSARMQVTANLYRPAQLRESMPGILICHSHHNPKTQSELQDMGAVWARAGCYVLVMDQLGHGERRQHPFRTSNDYAGSFKVSRQDYYFRYNVGIQLHLVGQSLIGWMAADLMRGVDVLLEQPNADPARIALLGAVAGGGDPVAVTAAIDSRIKAVVPFNFGGPQPETTFPLPEDAELKFNYVGGGSWESTRNISRSGRDGFLPWSIVAGVAPRRLIYAHEFSWDQSSDPVWKRLESVFELYEKREHLASAKGYGRVTLTSKEASHCNNIGKHHRTQIHPVFKRWFGIDVDDEFTERRDASELVCVDGSADQNVAPLGKLHAAADTIANRQLQKARREAKTKQGRSSQRAAWAELLELSKNSDAVAKAQVTTERGEVLTSVRFTLNPERKIHVPGILLLPNGDVGKRRSVVVVVAQAGKQRLLRERSEGIAQLLESGVAVCLPDLRGTGETRSGDYRGRRSNDTGLSSSQLMLGGSMLGGRLKDVLVVVEWLKIRDDIDGKSFAVWGDSLARVNGTDRPVDVPLGIDKEPFHSEPMGPTVALLAGMQDRSIRAVLARGGLVSMQSILDSQFVYVPHDFVVPGVLKLGDLTDIAASVAPRPARIEGLVDGANRRASSLGDWIAARNQTVQIEAAPLEESIDWLIGSLKAEP